MTSDTKPHWFIRFKLYHIPFWFAYHVMWWTITIRSFGDVAYNIFYSAYSFKFLFYVVFQAFGAYFNLYYLMPRLLYRGKYAGYIVCLFLTLLACTVIITSGYYFSAYVSKHTFTELYQRDSSDFMYFFSINVLPSTAASMTLAMSIKLAKNWVASQKRQQELEKEKLETELKFLKSQFNPHFLFNTINSIFVLIHKNPDLASESLATFSDLMRYQLYDCTENEISLDRELTFLEDFIALEKLRLDETHTRIRFEIDGLTDPGLTIAPFIMMPFVENAFKHVSRNRNRLNLIDIQVKLEEETLELSVSNTSEPLHQQSPQLGGKGIGLKNVRRRLELHYGQHYMLNIKEEDTFSILLQLTLRKSVGTENHYVLES